MVLNFLNLILKIAVFKTKTSLLVNTLYSLNRFFFNLLYIWLVQNYSSFEIKIVVKLKASGLSS